MSASLASLLRLLTLERVDENKFTGPPSNENHVRAFGGQLFSQALVAASSTVQQARTCHSAHCYFLRPANPAESITYTVERVRDGRSLSARRVEAIQGESVLFQLSA